MPRPVVIFEDSGFSNLLPLTYTRPASMLRCGIVTLWEKVAASYPSAAGVVLHTREYVAPAIAETLKNVAVNQLKGTSALLVNGRVIAAAGLGDIVPLDGDDAIYMCGDDVVAARVSGGKCAEVAKLLAAGPLPDGWADGLKKETVERPLIKYPWDLISHNPEQIHADFTRMQLENTIAGEVHDSAVLQGRAHIHVADGAEVHAGAILIATEGPIYIGPKAKIMAGAVLEGPISIGAKSSIKILAKIYEGTSIGEFCKVGGEIEECIFQAYSNKQHDGFMGHSYFGEWINIGADSNNSDLKNNYSNVKVTINGKQVDSGSMFVGSVFGDHSKTGINSMFNTGTVVGVGCNMFGAGLPPKYVPSFAWGGADGFMEHQFDKFATTAERVMGRRDRQLTTAGRTLLETVFKLTADERKAVIG